MNSQLATIKEVRKIVEIEGATRIELALTDSYQCVVEIGEFEVGDLGVFFRVGSMLPVVEPYEFLGKTTTDDVGVGYHIQQVKKLQRPSQGLLIPMTILSEPSRVGIDDDVSDVLGVRAYQRKGKE